MSNVQFGVGFAPSVPAPAVVDAAKLAEQLGYDVFWITDSHMAVREAMSMLGALAVSTTRINLGPGVSHLAGRHPTVIASAMATLDELAPGRIRLGIGVGDSGPLNLGVPRTSVRDLEAAVTAIRQLLQGDETPGREPAAAFELRPEARRKPCPDLRSRDRPAHVADGRPRRRRRADQRHARRVAQLSCGHSRGEQEAGRAAGSTRILFWTTACVDEDRQAARNAVRGSVARRAMNTFSRQLRDGLLGEEDRAALERLQAAHQQGHLWDTGDSDLVPERWIDRFSVAGTPNEVRERLERTLSDGADEISMILMSARASPADVAAPISCACSPKASCIQLRAAREVTA